jgi:hypothetical protein
MKQRLAHLYSTGPSGVMDYQMYNDDKEAIGQNTSQKKSFPLSLKSFLSVLQGARLDSTERLPRQKQRATSYASGKHTRNRVRSAICKYIYPTDEMSSAMKYIAIPYLFSLIYSCS